MCSGFATLLASSALALALSGAAVAQDAKPGVRLLVQSSRIAGLRHHAGAEVWDALRVGDRLELEREAANPFDANAIGLSWRGRKLGYVPRRENAVLAWGLDRGERLVARITRIARQANDTRRVEFEVYAE